jgi:hypothetical protein
MKTHFFDGRLLPEISPGDGGMADGALQAADIVRDARSAISYRHLLGSVSLS